MIAPSGRQQARQVPFRLGWRHCLPKRRKARPEPPDGFRWTVERGVAGQPGMFSGMGRVG